MAELEDLRFLDAILSLQRGETDNVNRALAGLDADRFHHWCLRHHIGGLTYLLLEDSSLRVNGAGSIAARLRGPYLEQWARTERLRLNLLTLDAKMGDIGEPYLVLKGLPFAARYYGAHDRRATGDLDIWVRRDRARFVADALEARGVKRRSPKYSERSAALDHIHQVEFDLDGTGVELHHALRVHPTFRIDEDEIWRSRTAVTIHGDEASDSAPTLTLSDEYALLLHLLGLHTDVQIAEVQARWFVDLHQFLLATQGRIDWEAFFSARTVDGTQLISVNALAMFLVLTRRDDVFPDLSAAVASRRDDVVGIPGRAEYLSLLRGDSLVWRKRWPLEQYEGGRGSAVAWWMAGLRHRITAKPAAFAQDVAASRANESPWDRTADPRTPALVAEFGIDVDRLQDTYLRLGDMTALVRAERASDVDALRELYRLRPGATISSGGAIDLTITLVSLGSALARQRVPICPTAEHPLERRVEIHEGIVHAWLDERARLDICIAVDRQHESRPLLLHALMVVMNRILARLNRYHLHSAAVGVDGATWLFVGAKGSGKSTISLALGHAGGIVFSEDHVMLRADNGVFYASGCDGDLHLTAETERHFFERPVAGEMVDRAGVPKKRVNAASVVRCHPHVETTIRGLVFPRVDGRFDIRRLAKEDAMLRLLAPLAERHRFADDAERAAFLARFASLVDSCETWELSLSRDLSELARLKEFLSGRAHPAPERAVAAPAASAP